MNETDENFKNVLFKLAFFEPNLKDDNDYQVLDYLVLDCLSIYSPLLDCNLAEIVKYIKTTYSIVFEEAEIYLSGKRLENKEFVIVSEPLSKKDIPRIKLLKTESISNQKKIQELEELVISQWSDNLISKYNPYVNKGNIQKIIEIFQSFLTKLLIRHGKESVATLYPDSLKTQEWLDSINDEIVRDLPKQGNEIDIILQIEIPLFFKENIKERKEYLNNLFNSSFIWHLIQVDDKCSVYFKETIKGQLLILDNNILYSLIGLHGPHLLNAIHNLLKYANQLGYKLMVTTKTLDEFYNSIKKSSEKSYELPSFSKNIANVAVEVLQSNNFLVSYLQEFAKNGLAIEEFALEKSHINNILTGFNITITEEFREEIEKSQELLDEESLLRESCGNTFNQLVIEHDAFHRIFIKKIRQNYKYKYSEAKAWFLTHDSKLSVYARFALKGNRALPFCMSTNEWIQINRPFLRRIESSEEFEKSFLILVTQPLLRSILSNFQVDKIKEKLLFKLNRYKNMDRQLGFDLATDVHFLHTLSKETKEEKFEEHIDSFIVDINKGLKDENKEIYEILEQQKIDNIETNRIFREKINAIQEELTSKYDSQNKLGADLKQLRETLSETKESKGDAENEVVNLKIKLCKQKQILKWGLFVALLIFVILFIWFFTKTTNYNFITEHPKSIAIKILLSLVTIFSLLNIPLSKHWKVWLAIIAAFIISLLGVVFSI